MNNSADVRTCLIWLGLAYSHTHTHNVNTNETKNYWNNSQKRLFFHEKFLMEGIYVWKSRETKSMKKNVGIFYCFLKTINFLINIIPNHYSLSSVIATLVNRLRMSLGFLSSQEAAAVGRGRAPHLRPVSFLVFFFFHYWNIDLDRKSSAAKVNQWHNNILCITSCWSCVAFRFLLAFSRFFAFLLAIVGCL